MIFSWRNLELNSDSVGYDFKARLCYPLMDDTQATVTLHSALQWIHRVQRWPCTTTASCIQMNSKGMGSLGHKHNNKACNGGFTSQCLLL